MHCFSLLIVLLLVFSGMFVYEQAGPGRAAPVSAEDYFDRGLTRVEKGDLDEAIADFTKAIEINPRYAGAYYNRGEARFGKDDPSGAIADFTKAIEINPRFAKALLRRGNARFSKDDNDGAIADCTKAIELDPRFAQAYFGRGEARFAKGDYDGSIADYTKAIEIEPQYAWAYAYRGITKQQQANKAEAAGDTATSGRLNVEGGRDILTAVKLDGSLKSKLEKFGIKVDLHPEPREGGRSAAPPKQPSSEAEPTTLEYNFYYLCNSERMMVTRCRKDSDQPGFPPTQPANDFCQVYYPDRPKHGGFDASAVELRGDLIKKIQTCTRTGPTG